VTSPLVGRDAELALVTLRLTAIGAGAGGVLVVLGEAGVGKSRLLAETARLAEETGLIVLTGRAVEGGGTYRALAEALLPAVRDRPELATAPGLRPYRAALGRLLPAWPAPAGDPKPAGDPEPAVDPAVVLAEGLLALLDRIAPAGCLLALDDLHWADPETLALVDYLAAAAATRPVLVAAAARDDGPVPVALDRAARRPGGSPVWLSRLGAADVAALVASRAAGPLPDELLRQLVQRSDGLPLLVEELLAGLAGQAGNGGGTPGAGGAPAVPPSLAGLVAGRLDRLDPAARRVVRAAAVLGADPDWALLAGVTGAPEAFVLDALDAAATAGLLVADGDRLRWRHALTRDAVLAAVLPPERAAVARRAAAALVDRGGPDDDALAAELLTAAGERAAAAEVLLRLARRDLSRAALRSALDLLTRAAATGAAPPGVAVERVRALTLVGDVPAAIEVGTAALAGVTGDAHAELCLQLARAAVVGSRWAQARTWLERAGRPDDPRSLVLAADAALGFGQLAETARLGAAAVARAERTGPPELLCEALAVVGRSAYFADPAAADAAFRRAAQVAAEHGLTAQRVDALVGCGTLELLDGHAAPALWAARELALDAGMLARAAGVDLVLLDPLWAGPGPAAAEPYAREAADFYTRLRIPAGRAVAEAAVAGCLAGQGRPAGDLPARDGIPPEAAAAAGLARAFGPLLAGDVSAAARLLDDGMAGLLAHDPAPPMMTWGLWVLLRTAAGDRDAEARERLRGHPAAARPVNRGALAYADAIAAGRAGDGSLAAGLLAAGDADLAGSPWWHRLLRLHVLAAAVVDGWGDPVPALRADLAGHERAGADALARTARDLLRRAGAPTRRGRGDSTVPPGLRALGVTSREMDVLALIAAGLTNAQVAQRLFLSVRTVETHVASLLAKTGATSRAELRVAAER
jgi:DNA-binding CsgD family transcriptional regulator